VAEFIEHRLQNYHPETYIVPARKRGTQNSPDDPEIAQSLLNADLIFMGPGSPTYAVRQLQGSLTWQYLVARHRLGAGLILASAAVVAIGAFALPVYEIYKVGEDPHWKPGLDLFGPYGLSVVFIPHWDNNDGGEELDTSRCFMGRSRFAELCALLPPDQTVLGIDENTALSLDIQAGAASVIGQGSVTLLKTASGPSAQSEKQYSSGEQFSLEECCPLQMPEPDAGIPQAVWESAVNGGNHQERVEAPPESVLDLVAERESSRKKKDYADADRLRKEILDMGWDIDDTPEGPSLHPSSLESGKPS
jgi:hypothetical protein